MEECQFAARDRIKPGMENDARKMEKAEEELLSCMAKTVDHHLTLLKPMKQRIVKALK